MSVRTGIGFDAHRFAEGRALILGGVEIPGGPGLDGHSDADVLCHAIADAALGAAALGDIGTHFPDSDPRWAGASSVELLVRVREMVASSGYLVGCVDATILLEAPKVAAHAARMRENIAGALGVSADEVSVKATTLEGLGTVGRGEGAACMAVVTLVSGMPQTG